MVAHEEPVTQTLNDILILLREFGGKMRSEDESALRKGQADLKKRFDAINMQALVRQNKLNDSLEELEKYREEFEEFEEWLRNTEQKQDELVRTPGRDLDSLKEQMEVEKEIMEEISDHKGDLKFIKRSGHKFLDNAKVSFLL